MKLHLDLPWGGTLDLEREPKERRLSEMQLTGVLVGLGLLLFVFMFFIFPMLWR